MSRSKVVSRREFLVLSSAMTGAIALAACVQAPAQPAPTQVAAAKPATAPTPAPPAAVPAPTAVPAAAGTKPDRQLVGKLEGYEIITNPAAMPKKFNEAPMLAELVKSGKLPSVDKRLPDEPLVVKPVHEIGKYGGTWRRGFTGPGDGENGNRIVSVDKLVFWDYTGTRIVPSAARDWQVSDDGMTTTIFLRKGMKWSDGQPFTADAFVFKFEEPYWMFPDILAGDTLIGRGQATGQFASNFGSSYAPRHYLKQFLPKYTSKEDIDRQVAEAKVDNWVSLLSFKKDWTKNPELPVIGPWKCVSPITSSTFALERNPYYWEVDTSGNQLPYLDGVRMGLAENLEVLNLRAVAGEYDVQERHVDIQKLPVYLENQDKGGYTMHLDPGLYGSDTILHVNQDYEEDPEVARWLTNRDFRHALALGIDRDQINETFFLGVGTPGSPVPDDSVPETPGPEYRKKWSVLDPKQANELLDKVGLDKKDADGYRLRTDGKGRLRIELVCFAGAFLPYAQHAEMIVQQWKKIGIQGEVKEVERGLGEKRRDANQNQITLWSNGGTEQLYLYPYHALPVGLGVMMGNESAKWYATSGKQGKEPRSAEMKAAMDLFRSAPTMKTKQERDKNAQEIWKIILEEQWSIGVVGLSPAFLGVRLTNN